MRTVTGHFRIVCRVCGSVITQCRCPSKDKRTEYALCERCGKQQKVSAKTASQKVATQSEGNQEGNDG